MRTTAGQQRDFVLTHAEEFSHVDVATTFRQILKKQSLSSHRRRHYKHWRSLRTSTRRLLQTVFVMSCELTSRQVISPPPAAPAAPSSAPHCCPHRRKRAQRVYNSLRVVCEDGDNAGERLHSQTHITSTPLTGRWVLKTSETALSCAG